MWVLLTAGKGPAECAWVVARLLPILEQEAKQKGLALEILETEAGPVKETLNSVLCSVEGDQALLWAKTWEGSLQWIGQSPFRPQHKRKNWFVGFEIFQAPAENNLDLSDLKFESLRSSGPGGQNVNKLETAVRLTHLPTGLSVLAREERTQLRNRQLALARMQNLIAKENLALKNQARKTQWQAHQSLERGNAIRIFKGTNFTQQN
ncbi:peptide chain release factor H [bacterium (Candidatus Blackallbacteria) CG17_big_fil_post_rev_8_21_14_2_50_48_46]|uniref:Peptide chain release factor H n=1 Tax=bacterium (Candidatus Blackallbacteria) CG17_big_fil_post_rev_8_21_14_2_50_48_46 TaxID=2014261 RepID=A0A2M7G6R5_9BACT|nr:MAG: peptide chain release factor H [bacterium (Candidatus Blackallbacteria) CG18_big_fil_WC_8_21_14_2_50_49_26]PIW17349.1 MAG: peptide chain release factor H [bacterium (Candidatus Blackallbacteria) CG17_big_fil_post_rev_8_21_14_2_50_48_46]PIW47419.1 MAG: peptide chain release factor H [bacterium (Candidatus Blackallbacteria) CG13_big_fil_rev_8_21_14_2_50_49_14]